MKTITTLLAALALVALAAACTSEMEAGIEGRTITVDPGTKPTYTEPNTDNPNTRTNPTTGQWEVGDKVEVTFTFYADDVPFAEDKQILTCTAAAVPAPDAKPAQWSAASAIIIAPGAATKVAATYSYSSVPASGTGIEMISGSVYDANGDPVLHPLPTTGTFALPAPTWKRRTALVVVENIPAGSTAKITYNSGHQTGFAQWKNETTDSATGHLHIYFGAEGFAWQFTLTINNNATPYKKVLCEIGKKYTIDARAQEPGTGGGNNQTITASSTGKTPEEIAAIFNDNPSTSFIITGTNVGNVKTALGNVIGTKKINLTMPDVTTVERQDFANCDALATISLPAATSIGNYAFSECDALTTVSLPKAKDIGISAFQGCPALTDMSLLLAETIGNHAFNGCTALTTISLPAATKFGWNAFHSCTALTRLELTAATAITVDSDTFTGINNNDPITLVLNSSAALTTLGITVENGTGENAGMKTVTFTNGGATIHVAAVVDPSGNPITTIN